MLIHALGTLPTAWYLDEELHECTHPWETLKYDFVMTFRLIRGTKAIDEALQDTDTGAWGESHLYVAPKVPTWEPRVPSMVKYCSLAPKEGKVDPQDVSNLELDEMHMINGPLGLRTGSIETHPTLAKIGHADII